MFEVVNDLNPGTVQELPMRNSIVVLSMLSMLTLWPSVVQADGKAAIACAADLPVPARQIYDSVAAVRAHTDVGGAGSRLGCRSMS
jgi:hypothetical protein